MSPLWRRKATVDNCFLRLKPSPTCSFRSYWSYGYSLLSQRNVKYFSFLIEGISQLISCLISKIRSDRMAKAMGDISKGNVTRNYTTKGNETKGNMTKGNMAKGSMPMGSMTVEAACLLPILLFFILHLTGGIEMMRLHGHIAFALREAGNHLTLYACVQERLEAEIPDIAVSWLYVQSRVETILGKEYLESSPLVYGSRGINYLASDYLGETECIDIAATYQVAPSLTIFPFPYLRMVNRYYGRAWTGFDVAEHAQEEDYRYVYVTEYGSVWHTTPECSYLNVQVESVGYSDVENMRNESGERYRRCELCDDHALGETVYLTAAGNRYHAIDSCRALVRRIRAILWQEELSYRPCSRCAG